MARYKETNGTQGLFLTVNLREQIIPGTFEWTVGYLIDEMDLSLFDKMYNNDESGAAAYHPAILLKIILCCYSKGIITSRKIEKACKENIIVKALAEDCEPDHATIAAFISKNEEAVKDLFTQILLKCNQLKLITGEMFAVDGCKLPSNASKEWSGTIPELTKKRDKLKKYISRIIKQHKELDKDSDAKRIKAKYKKTMGDDKERRERSVKRLKKKLKKIDNALKNMQPKMGTRYEINTNITDSESSLIKGAHGYIQGYNGVAVADSGNQVIVCAEIITGSESNCMPQMLDSLKENMKAVSGKEESLKDALLEGDTGFHSEENLQEAAKRKVEVLIPDQQFRQRDPYFAEKKAEKVPKNRTYTTEDFDYDEKEDSYICPNGKVLTHKCNVKMNGNTLKRYVAKIGDCRGCGVFDKCIKKRTETKKTVKILCVTEKKYEENLSQKMREKIDKPAYRELYSRRMQIIEPVFSDMTYCKKMDQFTLRTRRKVNIQWQLYCMVHNIGKCSKQLSKRMQKIV